MYYKYVSDDFLMEELQSQEFSNKLSEISNPQLESY